MKIYCVGTAKSGTHSIADLFCDQFRAQHEPESLELANMILAAANNTVDEKPFLDYLIKRDQRLNLQVDSSQLNFFIIKQLMDLFPSSKFILTIRHPYHWLASFINHQLGSVANPPWTQMREFRFRPDVYTHPAEESVLKENNLYTLDGYLSYWARHNQVVINNVPQRRLLIVRTDKISTSLDNIADFCGVPKSLLNQEKAHAFKAEQKFNILEQLDRAYLDKKITQHGGALIKRYF